jgi:hypothetical protein
VTWVQQAGVDEQKFDAMACLQNTVG